MKEFCKKPVSLGKETNLSGEEGSHGPSPLQLRADTKSGCIAQSYGVAEEENVRERGPLGWVGIGKRIW